MGRWSGDTTNISSLQERKQLKVYCLYRKGEREEIGQQAELFTVGKYGRGHVMSFVSVLFFEHLLIWNHSQIKYS